MIYKYIDHWGVSILRDKRIKITHPEEFNDPFELLPKINTVTREDLELRAKDPSSLERFYKISKERFSSRQEFDNWVTADTEKFIDALRIISEEYNPEEFRKESGKLFGITCFSSDNQNILMWSHYANSHQGMVIGFKESSFKNLKVVDYDSLRQEYSPVYLTSKMIQLTMDVFCRKSSAWTYEDESRGFVRWNECIEECIGDKKMFFYNIAPQDIQEVYLGCKASTKLVADIRNELKGDLAHVSLYKMTIHPENFELVPKTYD